MKLRRVGSPDASSALNSPNKHDKLYGKSMTKDDKDSKEISRRGFLELGSAAVAGVAGILSLADTASAQSSEKVSTGRTTRISDPGPTNKSLDSANPDISVPPLTDSGGVPTFKYPFSL